MTASATSGTQSHTVPKNGTAQLNRFSRLLGYTKSQSTRVGKTALGLAVAPMRATLRFFTGDEKRDGLIGSAKRCWTELLPTSALGLPLTIGAVAAGAAAPIAIGGLAYRASVSADSVLGGVVAGSIGFIVGCAIAVWLYELAVALACFEILALVAQVAQAEAPRSQPASVRATA